MRLARVRTDDGLVMGEYDDGVVTENGGESYVVGEEGSLVAPCSPSAFYCVGRNYPAYIEEHDFERPEHVSFFIKPAVSRCDPNGPLPYPSFTDALTYGAELAAVVGEECKEVPEDGVDDAILGYTIMNDVDASDQGRITMRKAFDKAAPLGPWIQTDLDPSDLEMETRINDEVRQSDTTASMLFSPTEIVSFISQRFTLQPGDVIAMGSPANPGEVEVGDEIEMWYESIGTLRNTVVAPDDGD